MNGLPECLAYSLLNWCPAIFVLTKKRGIKGPYGNPAFTALEVEAAAGLLVASLTRWW